MSQLLCCGLQGPAPQRGRGGGNREPATLGMLPAAPTQQQQQQVGAKRRAGAAAGGGSENEEGEAAPRRPGGGRKRAKKGLGVEGLALAEQEALALQLLQGRR